MGEGIKQAQEHQDAVVRETSLTSVCHTSIFFYFFVLFPLSVSADSVSSTSKTYPSATFHHLHFQLNLPSMSSFSLINTTAIISCLPLCYSITLKFSNGLPVICGIKSKCLTCMTWPLTTSVTSFTSVRFFSFRVCYHQVHSHLRNFAHAFFWQKCSFLKSLLGGSLFSSILHSNSASSQTFLTTLITLPELAYPCPTPGIFCPDIPLYFLHRTYCHVKYVLIVQNLCPSLRMQCPWGQVIVFPTVSIVINTEWRKQWRTPNSNFKN